MASKMEDLINGIEESYEEFRKDFKKKSGESIEYFIKKKKSDTGNYLKKINEYISIIKENKHYVIEPFSKWEDYNLEKDPIKDQWYFLTRDKYKDLINDFEKLRKNLLANKTFDGKKKLSNDSTINKENIKLEIIYYINNFTSLIKQMLKIDPYE